MRKTITAVAVALAALGLYLATGSSETSVSRSNRVTAPPDQTSTSRRRVRLVRPVARGATPPGRIRLRGTPQPDGSEGAPRDVPAESAPDPRTGAVRGEVITPAGEPIPGVFVVAVGLGDGLTKRTLSGPGGEYMLPDLEPGSYELWAVRPSQLRLRAAARSSHATQLEVTAGEDTWLDVELSAVESGAPPPPMPTSNATLTGHIVDARTGAPLAHVRIEALPGGDGRWTGRPRLAVSEGDGRFALTGSPAGAVRVLLSPDRDGHLGRTLEVEVRDGAIVDLGEISLPTRDGAPPADGPDGPG